MPLPAKRFYRHPLFLAVVAGVFVIGAAIIQRPAAPSEEPVVTERPRKQDTAPARPVERTLAPDGILAALDTIPPLRQSAAVRALYIGRPMVWTGVVAHVYEWGSDESNTQPGLGIQLRRPDAYRAILTAEFDTTWRDELSSLRKNDTITVSGTVSRVWIRMGEVYLKSAQLVNP